jgi:hypothetical protein
MRSSVLLLLYGALAFAAEPPLEFNRDIRPILSDNCFGCHGPDAKTKGVPFRLDIEENAKADLGGGRRGIVPFNPAASELVQRIATDVKYKKMPPAATGHSLSPAQQELITRWVREGAVWQKHWSFIPAQRPALPQVSQPAWPRNPIDSFVLAKLDQQNLKPSPEAAKERLLRRVSLDLTGLPPSREELARFLQDASPKAYEAAVDRLLASPRYGERMAMRWLDNARYADTNGYQFDGERNMWRWRDYVIESFHNNKPFDQFVREQIAGDLLPNATLETKIATGFNRNHRANTEAGIIPEEYAVEYVIDRVETTSAVMLGLTFGCARCHNHKYDPLTQKEMYQFYAYFNNVPEQGRAMKYGNSPPLMAAPTREQSQQLQALSQRLDEARAALAAQEKKLAAAQQAWEKTLSSKRLAHWLPHTGLKRSLPMEDPEATRANAGVVQFVPGRRGQAVSLDGKAYLDAGFEAANFDIEDRFTISAWIRSESKPNGVLFSQSSDKVHARGYGVEARSGKLHVHLTSDFVDDAIRLNSASEVLLPGQWHHVAFTYTGSRMAEGLALYVDGKPVPLQVELDSLFRPFANAGKRFGEPFRLGSGSGPAARFRGLIDEVNVWSRVLPAADIALLARADALAELVSQNSPEARRQLREEFLRQAAPTESRELWARIDSLQSQREALERSLPTVMVMAELPERKPTHILLRGEYNKLGPVVEPGLPSFLPPMPAGLPNDRLGLAQWMTAPQNPLLARVNINRVWQMIFGTGIVKTTEDFGSQGEWPSHPELLDWLATEFVSSGWDLKHMVKLMVTSAAYRQDSASTPELNQRDPDNRLLARGPRLRLPAESIRDQALLAAGLLTEKIGGPSFKAYQPDGLWAEQAMQDMAYKQSHGPDLYRRSIYTFSKRTISPPMMINFDASTRESCVVRENRSNTPLQALNLMNDVTFLEAGRQLGRRMLSEGGNTDEARLRYGFQILLSRAPRPEELRILKSSLNYHRDYFSTNPTRITAYLAQGESPQPKGLDASEQAAYMALGSLLLNLDEAVTKE